MDPECKIEHLLPIYQGPQKRPQVGSGVENPARCGTNWSTPDQQSTVPLRQAEAWNWLPYVSNQCFPWLLHVISCGVLGTPKYLKWHGACGATWQWPTSGVSAGLGRDSWRAKSSRNCWRQFLQQWFAWCGVCCKKHVLPNLLLHIEWPNWNPWSTFGWRWWGPTQKSWLHQVGHQCSVQRFPIVPTREEVHWHQWWLAPSYQHNYELWWHSVNYQQWHGGQYWQGTSPKRIRDPLLDSQSRHKQVLNKPHQWEIGVVVSLLLDAMCAQMELEGQRGEQGRQLQNVEGC